MPDAPHRTPSSPLPPDTGGWRRRRGTGTRTPPPHPRLRGTCGARSRPKAGGGGSQRPPTPRSPPFPSLRTAKAGEAGEEPNLPARGPSLARRRVPLVRVRGGGERSVPKLRRCPGGWMCAVPPGSTAAAVLSNSLGGGRCLPGGSGRSGERSPRGNSGGRRAGRSGERAPGAFRFPAQPRSEGKRAQAGGSGLAAGVGGGEGEPGAITTAYTNPARETQTLP